MYIGVITLPDLWSRTYNKDRSNYCAVFIRIDVRYSVLSYQLNLVRGR
jgi:hypothetical protein